MFPLVAERNCSSLRTGTTVMFFFFCSISLCVKEMSRRDTGSKMNFCDVAPHTARNIHDTSFLDFIKHDAVLRNISANRRRVWVETAKCHPNSSGMRRTVRRPLTAVECMRCCVVLQVAAAVLVAPCHEEVPFSCVFAMNSHDEGCLAQLPHFHHCRVDEVADLLGSSLLCGNFDFRHRDVADLLGSSFRLWEVVKRVCVDCAFVQVSSDLHVERCRVSLQFYAPHRSEQCCVSRRLRGAP